MWSMIVTFTNLSKNRSDLCRNLENRITKWKQGREYYQNNGLLKMYELYKESKMEQEQILQEINNQKIRYIAEFQKDFKEEIFDGEDIKMLKRQEKERIISKTLLLKEHAKKEMERIKMAKKIRIANIEGDRELTKKAAEIANSGHSYL